MTTQTMTFPTVGTELSATKISSKSSLMGTLRALAEGIAAARSYEAMTAAGIPPQQAVRDVFDRHFASE